MLQQELQNLQVNHRYVYFPVNSTQSINKKRSYLKKKINNIISILKMAPYGSRHSGIHRLNEKFRHAIIFLEYPCLKSSSCLN